ncbi:putative pentatricopeptide repeat-containing protein At1g64310 [Malania oleifera]|uniref:putative pentatricopeptide repeat-containing protein At1g64310 n=1 Tax=Malania oleifera TaxID=397392 RepID=UPI0025ADD7F4|nr:putative pentatricopeptide repeat-containing protein At1g64310 [Malania oleifera]XP_057951936.1 putative pentatricopeptide repeat-containing protein At1g64310 [Malania oleifera]XP_057951938.1 putative pentatricopeptide repeat-containing protein At1g64310 [Malania oleifera]XP_057951939.1 putative pentatricopeptide repeat-containing protein At1g64310 [Malania oleifera]
MFFQFSSLLSELSKLNLSLSRTKQLHALIMRTHLAYDPFYATKIIRFYAINDDLLYARNLFEQTPQRSVYLWNSIIRAYAQAHRFEDAFFLFQTMLRTKTKPDSFTFACIMRACLEYVDLDRLRAVHGGLVVFGLGMDSISGSALVSAYSKLGMVDDASRVFNRIPHPDLVLWNSIISGYGSCGLCEKALILFSEMRHIGVQPDGYTLVGLISGLADFSLLEIGHAIHGYCLKSSFDSNVHTSSILVSMYSRCGCLNSAQRVFNGLLQPDLVTWSALITGYSQCGDHGNALLFFRKMNLQGKKADPILIASTLAASAQLADIGRGSEIHGHVVRRGYESEVTVNSALIDMYSKCGFIGLGIKVFETMAKRNTISYNSVISGLGLHGLSSQAFKMFEEMLEKGFRPDDSTFSALLCTCCHAGLVKDGWEFFRRMKYEFGIQAGAEHYIQMVRLLAMYGELEDAYNLILTLPGPVESGIWGALLSCCDAHGNAELAEIAAERLFENKPEKTAYRVMLSNIYAGDGRWGDVEKLRDDMIKGGTWKMPGISWWRQ